MACRRLTLATLRVLPFAAPLLATSLGAAAQGVADDSLGLGERWRWRTFDRDAGLPLARIRDVEEGFDGTLWVGSDRGPHWFDGFEFHPAPGAPMEAVYGIAPLADGRVVIQFQGGLWLTDRERGRALDLATAIAEDTPPFEVLPRRVAATLDGELIVEFHGAEHPNGAVLLGTPEALVLARVPGVRPRPANRADPHRGQNAIVAMPGALLEPGARGARWEVDERWTIAIALPEPERRGALAAVVLPWEDRGLWEIRDGRRTRVEATAEHTLTTLDVGPSGEAVALLRDGRYLSRANTNAPWHGPFPPPSELEEVSLVRFLRNGDLVVANLEGLSRVRRSALTWRDEPESAVAGGHGQVFSIVFTRDGALWLGTARGIERRGPDGRSERIGELDGHELRDITALTEDAEGRLWIGSGSGSFVGLLVLDIEGEGEGEVLHIEGASAPGAVHALATDRAGHVWIAGLPYAGFEGGLWRFDGTLQRMPLRAPPDDPTRVYAIVTGESDELWVGTSFGLFRGRADALQPALEFTKERGSRVWALCSDGGGGVWFGHGPSVNGLGRLGADGRVEYFAPIGGHPEPRVVALTRDAEDRVWVAGEDELLVVSHGELRRIDDRSLRPHTIAANEGEVLIGTLGRGLVGYSPSAELGRRTRLDVSVDVTAPGIAVAQWRPWSEWCEVPAERILTRYRVGQGPWTSWSTQHGARINALGPGSHLLTVEALAAHGLDEGVRSSRVVHIQRPVWARFEFLAPTMLSAVILGALVVWSTLRWLREARAHRESTLRFRQFADHVRDVFWLVDWRTGEALYVNPAYEALVGVTVAEAMANSRIWRERLHPDDQRWVVDDYRRAIDAAGEWDAEFRFVRPSGEVVWVHARAFAIRDADGSIARVAGIAEEFTDRRTAEARQQRLSLELDHRVKNVLAQVTAIAEQTVARTTDFTEFSRAFVGRVRAMARTHEALAANRWDGVPLRQVIETSLGPTSADGRCALDGPEVVLSPRASSSLGLALHELCTNAVKYGALSVPSGGVGVTWRVDESGILHLTWREHGGAEVRPPKRVGLGLALIRGLIEHDLGGAVELCFDAAGLVCELEVPGGVASGTAPSVVVLAPATRGPAARRRGEIAPIDEARDAQR